MSEERRSSGAGPALPKQVAKGGATTVVLALLAERPMYGYELVQTIRDRSEGLLSFGEGTVYPILYALRDKGYVSSERQQSDSGRPRRVYQLTPEGREALVAYRSEWSRLTEGMRLALEG